MRCPRLILKVQSTCRLKNLLSTPHTQELRGLLLTEDFLEERRAMSHSLLPGGHFRPRWGPCQTGEYSTRVQPRFEIELETKPKLSLSLAPLHGETRYCKPTARRPKDHLEVRGGKQGFDRVGRQGLGRGQV